MECIFSFVDCPWHWNTKEIWLVSFKLPGAAMSLMDVQTYFCFVWLLHWKYLLCQKSLKLWKHSHNNKSVMYVSIWWGTFSVMKGLEELRPFIWLCQLSGFFPYRMEVDRVTKRFKRFTFSFSHPVTIWYFSLQSVFLALITDVWMYNKFDVPHSPSLTFLHHYLSLMRLSDMISVYVLIWHCSLINRAVAFLLEVNESLKHIGDKSFNITRHIYIGAAYTLISVHTFVHVHWTRHIELIVLITDGSYCIFATQVEDVTCKCNGQSYDSTQLLPLQVAIGLSIDIHLSLLLRSEQSYPNSQHPHIRQCPIQTQSFRLRVDCHPSDSG